MLGFSVVRRQTGFVKFKMHNYVYYFSDLPSFHFFSYLSKEQVVELVLPRYCHVGHVDIRFTLSPMTTQPATNVYLLKPTCPSSFKPNHKTFSSSVAQNQKGILSSAQEQDTIVSGPVNLKLGLDSTGRHGRVTLTSPQLIKTSSRILLIVFDNCSSSEDLSEVSITVTRFKSVMSPDCQKLRSSLLESSATHLLDIVVGSKPVEGAVRVDDGRKLALELLCWIAGVWLNYNARCCFLLSSYKIVALQCNLKISKTAGKNAHM